MSGMPFPFNVFLFTLLGAALSTGLTLPLWRAWCRRTGVIDDPGHRKIHATPIPLAGGVAVMTGLLVPLLAAGTLALLSTHWSVAALPSMIGNNTARLFEYGLDRRAIQLAGITFGAFGMLMLGLLDDKFELRPGLKFTGQLLVALIVAAAGVRITLFIPSVLFSYFITVLWILTLVNAFNFMDNMNGLCAGLGAIGAWYFGVFAASYGEYLVATIAFLITGALAGFLPYNFPKATAFLGDSGSHLTGYLLAILAILPHFFTRQHPNYLAVFTPLLILAVPLADLLSVVILRWKMGKPFYIGDTNHLSHRLVRSGCTPQRAVLYIWLMAAAAGALAFL